MLAFSMSRSLRALRQVSLTLRASSRDNAGAVVYGELLLVFLFSFEKNCKL